VSALTENDVVTAVANYLRAEGWTVLQTLSTRDRGVDVIAARGESTLHVEAKGATSARIGSARHGRPFDRSQVRDHVAKAVLTALEVASRDDGVVPAIAFPGDRLHREFVDRVAPAIAAVGVRTFYVSEDGAVS
jgi:hypothetical protein